ncbi:MAG TPA: hypothetical protein DCE78_09985 [Bacteroidetes bacterium]|nr:hypothetical protein [Bacteroidota bacterium]
MLKISDPEYRLPYIDALSTFDLFDKGTTAPIAIWGVDTETGDRGQFVVKMKSSERMSTKSSAFELIGAWMAMELDLPVVEPVLVNLSADFVETVRNGYRAASQSVGLNFGSRYQSGFSNLPQMSYSFLQDHFETIKLIYVFDLFIANTDRGHQRDNIQSNGSNLLIYDHELAFSFLRILPFLQSKTPWILNETDKDLYQKHLFFKYLREMRPNLTQQVVMLERFNSDFWDKVYYNLPEEWIDDQVSEIRPYLTSIIENLTYFTDSLNNTLTI